MGMAGRRKADAINAKGSPVLRREISWTKKCDAGVKREVRVTVTKGGMRWQFKRSDEGRWDYESMPTADDWNTLEEILARRVHRGRGINMRETVRKLRGTSGA